MIQKKTPQDNVKIIIYILILITTLQIAITQDSGRASITNNSYSITADSVELDSKSKTIKADGTVTITDIDKYFIADSLFMKYDNKFNGEMHKANGYIKPFYITGAVLMFTEDGSATLHAGTVTTCKNKKPHYCFVVNNLNLSPDHKEIYLDKAGLKIFGISLTTSTQFKININDNEEKDILPITPGFSQVDGVFIEAAIPYQINNNLKSKTTIRYGTANLLRAAETLTYKTPFVIAGINPLLSVTASNREDSQYNIAGGIYRNQTYSKLPEFSIQIPKLPIFKLAGQWHLTGKANYGDYHENLSGIQSTRGDAILVLDSPRKIIGNTALQLELAGQKYYYPGITRGTNYVRLTTDKKKNEGFYWKAAYQHRHDSGGSPFFFDRNLLKDELETGVEFNIWRKSPWRVGFTNIQDLNNGKSNDTQIKLKYSLDCMNYKVIYSRASESAWFGIEMRLE
jgi:hypothetical protein